MAECGASHQRPLRVGLGVEAAEHDPFPTGGWRREAPGYVRPGSVSWLTADDGKPPPRGGGGL